MFKCFQMACWYPKIKSTKIFHHSRKQGTYRPSWGRSAECLFDPVTVQCIVPPRRKKSEHNFNNFQGKCPTTTPPLVMATEYRSAVLWSSLSHTKTSATAGFHMFIYMFRAICKFVQFRNCTVQIRNCKIANQF